MAFNSFMSVSSGSDKACSEKKKILSVNLNWFFCIMQINSFKIFIFLYKRKKI